MTRFGMLVAGSVVGLVLTLGMSGVALAAPVTSTTTASPSTTVGSTGTTSPTTSSPTTTSPSTSSPTTTAPSASSPSTTAPSQTGLSKSLTRTANEIWRIVRPHKGIDCAKASQQLKRVRSADAAAAKRLGRWQSKNSADQSSQSKHAAVRVKHASNKVRTFQKLEKDGQALIVRIDAKCGAANSSK